MGPAFANRGLKKGPTEKSDRFFKYFFEKRELATKPFMPHFNINYIIFNEGKKSHVISFPINIYYLFTIKLNTSIASEFLLCGCNTFTSINILRNCAFVIP